MGVEWSSANQETLNEISLDFDKADSASTKGKGIRLFKYNYTDDALTNLSWQFVGGHVVPRFYNENEDIPSKRAHWKLEIEAGQIDSDITHGLELLGDKAQLRVTFREGNIWALKFPTVATYSSFWNEYNNKLFENIYGSANNQANREAHLGADFASRMFTDNDAEDMDWNDEIDDEVKQERVQSPAHSIPPVPVENEISLFKAGIGERSYLVRGNHVDLLKNVDNGVTTTDLSFDVVRSDGCAATPTTVMLTEQESHLAMLDREKRDSLIYADIASGKVVHEWSFIKDDVQIPMTDIVAETKNAPAEHRSSFLSFDKNRLCRWDTRDPNGIVQEYVPKLDYLSGKDYSQYTNFTCMATAGNGSVVVGSRDGKVRLYSNKLTLKRASTAFPAIGTPITHVDVTYDGKWVVATTDHFIEVLKTEATDDNLKKISGFHKALGARASMPKLLKLRPEDAMKLKHAPLRKARFTFVTEDGYAERWIVASCGSSSILWNFRQVKISNSEQQSQGGMSTCMVYHLVNKDETVVDSCFLHESQQTSNGQRSDTALVVATPHKVWSFAES